MSDRLRTEILSELNDAWLNISYEKGDLGKPFDLLTTEDPDEFYKTFTWLMIQPEYFCFLCKNILNVDLVPFQGLMLEEIWKRKFPMLIGSRGVGKAGKLSDPVLTSSGWVKMGDINLDHKVYGRDGLTHNITGIYPQGKKQVCRLKFADGREIDCCEDHLWIMKKHKKEVTVSTKDIINDGVRFDSPSGKWAYKYKLPLTEPIQYEEKELPLDPYLLGCLLGDGCMTTKTPKIASDDMFIIDQFKTRLEGFEIVQDITNNNYTIVDRNKDFTLVSRSNCADYLSRNRNRLTDIIEGMKLNVGCKDKFIPEEYKSSSVDQRMEIVRGLLDTDGSCNKDGSIEFTNTCKQLVDDLIDVLRSLGISCQWKIDDRSGTSSKIRGKEIPRNPYYRVFINTSKRVFKLPRKVERLKNKQTSRERYTSLISAEYVDEFEEMQCISVDSADHTYITKDYIVTHNTFLLSLYSLIRALIMPERKVVVVGAAFRQSKFLHEYMETIWKRAPILRDICDANSGPRTGVDMCRMIINSSTVTAIPVGDGCVSPLTLTTYDDGFGKIIDEKTSVWGNGKFRHIDYNIDNGVKPTKVVATKKGYYFEATHNHAMKILRNGTVNWVRTDEMVKGDRILIDRSQRWHNGEFECGEDAAYALGLLIGDGSWTTSDKLIRFATEDNELSTSLNVAFNNDFKQQKDIVHWNFYGKEKIADWLNFWKLKPNCKTIDKELPPNILKSNKKAMSACLSGLFDSDGHVFVDTSRGGTTISVNFTNTSKRLVEQMQYILLHYGIISTLRHRDRDEKWNRVYELGIYGPNVKLFADQINFHLSRKKEKLNSAIAQKKRWNSFGDDVPVLQEQVLSSLENNNSTTTLTPSKIKSRKTFQTNFLQKVLSNIDHTPDWAHLVNPDIYYDEVVSIEDSQCHTYDIHVPEGNEYCANGFFSHNSKIRGLRANDIVSDEFACLRYNTLVETNLGLQKIEEVVNKQDSYLINESGDLERPIKYIKTPLTDVYKIRTKYGYEFSCSNIHQVKTDKGWKLAKDLDANDYLLFDNKYTFPDQEIVDEKTAELMGLLVSEGSITNKNTMAIATVDKDMIDWLNEEYKEYNPKTYTRDPYTDDRGWECKKSYSFRIHNTELRNKLYDLGLNYTTAHTKEIPWSILQSSRRIVVAFLRGLFYGDGSCFIFEDRKSPRLGCSYYSVSEELTDQVHIVLWKLGYLSLKQPRKSKISKNVQWMIRLNGDYAQDLLSELNIPKFNNIMNSSEYFVKTRHKIGSLANTKNGRYRATVYHKGKDNYIGTFDSTEEAYKHNKEYLDSLPTILKVKDVQLLPDQEHLYDFELPDTHSFMGNGFVQHNSQSLEIFENVIAGFGAVSASPSDGVKLAAAKKLAKEKGYDPSILQDNFGEEDHGNQIVLSGTAYYDFNHFSTYWKRWRSIIHSKGDPVKLKETFGEEEIPDGFDWREYSVIRMPFELIPKGFMDDAQVARSKATVHNGIYLMEFSAVFCTDSSGFFKRSLIEACTGSEQKPIKLPEGELYFDPSLKGEIGKQYIIGVDPASEVDNFSIVVLEVNSTHRRIAHVWTTTRKEYRERLKRGLTEEGDFYAYCARRIRDLMGAFPTVHIAMDAQGGGIAVSEALHDPARLKPGELPIWPTIDEEKEQPTDDEQGLHILELCQFAKYDWLAEANHGLRKDFEDKVLLFPRFDPVTIGLSIEQDKALNRTYDTLEDCVMEIESLKGELCLIEIRQTPTGRDQWNTPEVKTGVGKKDRLRKDRYSALLMANMAARQTRNARIQDSYEIYGGFAEVPASSKKSDVIFLGPNWYTEKMNGVY